MNNVFSGKLKTMLVLAVVLCFTSLFTTTAQTICDNATGTQGGYTYEYWKDTGTGCMTLGSGGTFSVEWSDIGNLLARKGLRPGGSNVIVDYSCDFTPGGHTYLCVYGWTKNPLVEYYIVDSWGIDRAPGGEGHISLGTIDTDGGTYDIYRTERVDKPSIEGTATFSQYWSVRTSTRTSGTITCANHFNAWAGLGMNMGNFYEVSLCIEGQQSNGNANVTSMSMITGTPNPTPDSTPDPTPSPSPVTTGNIVVRARGTMGGENLELRIDGNVAASWTMTTGYQDYFADGSGTIEVHFTNDDQLQNGMDIQVDYIDYNNITYQAEDQEVNTGVYINGACGGSYSDMLQCDGYIRFDTGSTTPDPTPVPTPDPTPVPTPDPTPQPSTPGDVNSDGTADIVDALLVAQYYVGLNPADFNPDVADTNCDGNIDIVDALLIAQYYVGLINSFC